MLIMVCANRPKQGRPRNEIIDIQPLRASAVLGGQERVRRIGPQAWGGKGVQRVQLLGAIRGDDVRAVVGRGLVA